jgi:hypothetical protein
VSRDNVKGTLLSWGMRSEVGDVLTRQDITAKLAQRSGCVLCYRRDYAEAGLYCCRGDLGALTPYGRVKSARDAAAITAVAAQPQIAIDRDSVSRPMTLGLRTISIITAMSGAASTPLTTAAQ